MILKAVLIFALLFLFMMMGAPMAIALGASTVITLVTTTSLGITTIATACFSGLDSFPLLAVPFFILAGNLMKFGGLSNKILEFADALVGHIKGSLGMVAVVASMFFAALSGSSPATVSAIGSLTIPKMEEEGYDRAYATALNAAAGTIYDALRESVLVNGQTMFLVGFSMGFARFLTMSQIPASIAAKIGAIDSKVVVFLMINLFLLIVGCFIDNISSMLILTPIFLPIVQSYGMTPVQFGIVMTVNLCIGFITPPYGANLFIASAISDVPIMNIAKKIMPMIGAMLIVLMALTFIPALSTFAL